MEDSWRPDELKGGYRVSYAATDISHGTPDPFSLAVKAAILLSRAAGWLRRYMRDKGKGMDAEFAILVSDVYLYQ